MKTFLVYASIANVGFNSFGRWYYSTLINHGLCSISAYAKQNGFDISLIDLRRLKDWNEFATIIDNEKPDIVGLGMMTMDYNPVMKCIEVVKDIEPNVKIVVGGVHPTVDPESVLSNQRIDYVILGEGEITFSELLKDISNGGNVPRLLRGTMPDLDRLPFDDRELFDYKEVIKYPFLDFPMLPVPMVTIITGRGCMYNCSFCQPSERLLFGDKVRRRSIGHVMEELIELKDKYNFRSLMIHDDCFAEDRNYVLEFCENYINEGLKSPFWCQARADIICKNKDLIRRMKEAGLAMLSIGFESGSQRILDLLRKGTTVEQNYEAADICKQLDIPVYGNFMMGIPTETKKDLEATVRLIEKIKPYWASVTCYTPLPGSDLATEYERKGLLMIKNYDEYNRGIFSPKIKGVDYDRVVESRCEALRYREPFFTRMLLHPLFRKIYRMTIKNWLERISIFDRFKDYTLNLFRNG